MSHITGTIRAVTPPVDVGPNNPQVAFEPEPVADGVRLVMLHFENADIPAGSRLEVRLGYDTDVFSGVSGELWTRPANPHAFADGKIPIAYVASGAPGEGARLDRYGRGERHVGEINEETGQPNPSFSNSDPFLEFVDAQGKYLEPDYDESFFCDPGDPPEFVNAACASDVRAEVAPSVGMIVSLHGEHVSTCTCTLVDENLVLTAGHCFFDFDGIQTKEEIAASASVTFDYGVECTGAKPAGYEARFHKVVAIHRFRFDPSAPPNGDWWDYALLELRPGAGGITGAPIELRVDRPVAGDQLFGVHHPNGAVKKISPAVPAFSSPEIALQNAAAWASVVKFDTSGGSSGSGLFDSAGRCVGVLSLGACSQHYFSTEKMRPDIQQPAQAPPVTRDVMVVFDRSGSMDEDAGSGLTKIEEGRNAAELFVELIRADTGNRLGLVSFSTAASDPVDFPLADVTQASKEALTGSGGVLDGLDVDGMTSIGGGLQAALGQLPAGGANPRAILLLTDGLQNKSPMIEDVEPSLAGIEVHAIGFGTESNLDGALLTQLAQSHGGLYTRVGTGLGLRKFFAIAFGNIFESGALVDPDGVLPAGETEAEPIEFEVCDEEAVTVVLGWEARDARLDLRVVTPGGATVSDADPDVEQRGARTWRFTRVALPYGRERAGTWRVEVFGKARGDVHFFVTVLANGGPRLRPLPRAARHYTGDTLKPSAALFYADEGFPPIARVSVAITKPDAGAGEVVMRATPRRLEMRGGDALGARHAILQALEREAGGPAIGYGTEEFELYDDAAHGAGTFRRSGIFADRLEDVLTVEGSYTLRYRARYGDECVGTRDATQSIHVEVGVDPGRTDVRAELGRPEAVRRVNVTIVPRDRYGNHLGPGRAGGFSVAPLPGTELHRGLRDNGDGSYEASGRWDPRIPAALPASC